ncbi:MAG TPA: TolC family protein, partial [Rhizomicrobium sp.]
MRIARGFVVALISCMATVPALGADKPAAAPEKPSGFSLLEALSVAYETNPQLGAAQAGLRASDESVAQANAKWRPNINATGTYGFEKYNITGTPGWFGTHPLNAQLGISQAIFRGGRTYAE